MSSFIAPCIESIFQQNLPANSFEIVCYNDASTDGTLQVLKDLSLRYPNIKICSGQENKGVSFARNACLEEALGKYIWFVDPDDLLIPNVAKPMVEFALKENVDILLGNYRNVPENYSLADHNNISENLTYKLIGQGDDYLPKNLEGTRMCSICCGLLKKDFLENNRLRFREGMIAQEDTLFYYEFSQYNPVIYKFEETCYLYRKRASSVMNAKSQTKPYRYYQSMKILMEVYESYWKNNKYNDKEILQKKIHHTRENLVWCLLFVTEKDKVRQEYNWLKEKGYYPYPFRKASLSEGHFSMPIKLMRFMLPLPIVFWASRYLMRVLSSKN